MEFAREGDKIDYFAGLDLGQAQDYSALVLVERYQPATDTAVLGTKPPLPRYGVRYLKRWPLDTSYPRIVHDVATLLEHPPLAGNVRLIVDYTGCGRPVVDMFRQAGLHPRPVHIHGGQKVTDEDGATGVPKRDLVATVAVVLQQQRLQIAESLPETPTLTHELVNFKVEIDPRAAHDSYSAWREADHDDLVLSLALALWWGEHRSGRTRTWNPYGGGSGR
jgi:hypothetical protein